MLDQILQELYIGKTPELLEIESLIHKIRSDNTEATFLTDPTYSKDMKRINRIFEDLFGFELFSITIIRSSSTNAFTMPISSALDIMPQYRVKENLLVSNSKGFKYKKEAGYCCLVFMYNSLLFNKEFSDAEILAIILHEIGHNFQSVINDTLYYTSDIVRILNIIAVFIEAMSRVEDLPGIISTIVGTGLGMAISTNKFKKAYTNFMNEIMENDNLQIIVSISDIINRSVEEVKMNIRYLSNLVLRYGNIPGILKSCILSKVSNPFGKTGEEVADSFATIYGYGPEISSAMLKFETIISGPYAKQLLWSCPLIGQLLAIYDLPLHILLTAFDEHPSGIQRAQLAKSNLERELKQSYMDPAMKAKLKKDISDIDDAISEYKKACRNIKNPNAIHTAWYNVMYEIGKGGNTKKSERLMSNIDKAFNNVKLR